MKEKEFRAWDGENKKMIFWTLNDLLVRFGEPEYQFGVEDRPSVFFDWMEYTSLKDKNGKKIYEGDVVKQKVGNEFKSRQEIIGEVRWHPDGQWGIKFMSEAPEGYFQGEAEAPEIIGNIYENPELIKSNN